MLRQFASQGLVEGRFAARVVTMEAPHDMPAVADAEGVGQLAQVARRLAALAQVAVIAQQAQEAGIVALDMRPVVQGQT